MRRTFVTLLAVAALLAVAPSVGARAQGGRQAAAGSRVGAAAPITLTLPNRGDSVRLMVVGDTGTGSRQQNVLAQLMLRYRQAFPFEFALMVGGKLRKGDVKDGSPLTAKAYDRDMSFMLVEFTKDAMHFQVISRTGETVDPGVLPNQRRRMSASN